MYSAGIRAKASTSVLAESARRAPDRVLHAVGGSEVVERWRSETAGDFGVDFRRAAIGQEHHTRLRPQLDDVPRAIVFLVAARTLVLLDDVLLVLVDRETGGDADLLVRPHAQAVEVHRRRVLDDERRLRAQRRQVLARQLVDICRVRIGPRRQIDLRARDVEKTQGIAGRELPRFFYADDIVGNRGYRRRCRRRRAQGPEGMKGSHQLILACRSDACRRARASLCRRRLPLAARRRPMRAPHSLPR